MLIKFDAIFMSLYSKLNTFLLLNLIRNHALVHCLNKNKLKVLVFVKETFRNKRDSGKETREYFSQYWKQTFEKL